MLYTNPDDSDIEGTRAFPALGCPPEDAEQPPLGNERQLEDAGWPRDGEWTPEHDPPSAAASAPTQASPAPPMAAVLAERLYRFRPDRLILAGGSIAAAVAVAVGFATASGASTPLPPAPRPAVCATPSPGR